MRNVGCAFTFVLSFTLKQMLLQMLQFLSVKRHFTFIHKIDYWLFHAKSRNTLHIETNRLFYRYSYTVAILYLVYQDEIIKKIISHRMRSLRTSSRRISRNCLSVSKTKSPFHVPLTCRRNCDRASRSSKKLPLLFVKSEGNAMMSSGVDIESRIAADRNFPRTTGTVPLYWKLDIPGIITGN